MIKYFIVITLFFTSLLANIGKISAITGDASIHRNSQVLSASLGMSLLKNDVVQTKANAKLQIIFKDKTIITIGKNSSLDIEEYLYDTNNPKNSKANFSFFKGAFKTVTGTIGKLNKEKFILKTKSSTIGIRGTIVVGNQEVVACTQGGISVTSNGVTVDVDANELTTTKEGEAPTPAQPITNESMQSLQQGFTPDNSDESEENSEEENDSQGNDNSQTNNEQNESSQEQSTESDDNSSNSGVSNVVTSDSEVQTDIETPVVETTEVEDNTDDTNNEMNLKGRILGFDGTTNMPGDDITATKLDTKITFSATGIDDLIDSDTSSISGSKTFDTTFSSSYTTFGSSSEPLATMTLSSKSYDVYIDSKGEVFLLTHDNGTTSKEMIVVGKSGSSSSLNSSKVYRYDIFKELEIERSILTSVLNSSSNTKFSTTDNGSIYYNAKLNSSTYLDKKIFEEGASFFSAGDDSSMKHYENEYVYDGSVTNYFSNSSIMDIDILGSQAQALAVNIHTQRDNQTSDSIDKYSDLLVAAFMDTDATTTATTTGTYSLSGYSSYLLVSNMSTPAFYHRSSSNQTVSLDVNRASGNISGNIADSSGSPETAILEISGDTSNKDAYYITDDLFGSLGATGSNSNTSLESAGNLTDATQSAFIAVPDGAYVEGVFKMFDSNDNPLMSDDSSSWGYWTADYGTENDAYVDPLSTWVAGVETQTSDITAAITAETQQVFNGKVLGYVEVNATGKIDKIDMNDSTNEVKLTFNFGDGVHNLDSANSYIRFNSVDSSDTISSSWDMNMSTPSGSSTANFSGTLSGTNQSGNFNGKMYGSGIKSVGGNFDATNSSTSDKSYGVFKATKQ